MKRLAIAVGTAAVLVVVLFGLRGRFARSPVSAGTQPAEATPPVSPAPSEASESPSPAAEKADTSSDEVVAQSLLDYCAEIVESLPDPPFTYSEKSEIRTSTSPTFWFPGNPMDCKRSFRYDGKVAYPSIGVVEYAFDARQFKKFAVAVMPAYDQRLSDRWHRHCTTIPSVDVDLANIWESLTQAAKYTLNQPQAGHQVLLHVYLSQSELGVAINVYPPGVEIPAEAFQLERCS